MLQMRKIKGKALSSTVGERVEEYSSGVSREDNFGERGDPVTIKTAQDIYTFRCASFEQVADLCELWEEDVVESNAQLGIVRVKADKVSVDQFLMFYGLCRYLDDCEPTTTLDE